MHYVVRRRSYSRKAKSRNADWWAEFFLRSRRLINHVVPAIEDCCLAEC